MTTDTDLSRRSISARARRAGAAAALVLAGCAGTSGPGYSRPETDLPPSMPGATAQQSGAPRADWWRMFGDAELDRLVDEARAGNLDLVVMEARIREARLAARRAGAADAFRLDANAAYTRSRASENSVPGAVARTSDPSDPQDVHTISADASWEPDLFGRVRRGVEAAEADADAVEDDRRAMEVALIADVADAWFDVGRADAETAIQREAVDLLEQTLKLVQARVDAGLVSEVDLRRTEGDLASARSLLPEAERQRAVAENRLAFLVGKAPGLQAKGRAPASFAVPADIPVGIPAGLLERRPDVRAAERRVAAADARVGQAIADFYPRVRILGRAGFSSIQGDDILKWGSRIWSIAPSVTLPILDGGEREFRKLEAEARRDADTAAWMQTILRALNEVGDAMVSIEARRRTRDAVRATVAANDRSVELSLARYREGITSFLEVLDAQRARAASKTSLLGAERAVLAEVVRLHRALGGGWTGQDDVVEEPVAGSPSPR